MRKNITVTGGLIIALGIILLIINQYIPSFIIHDMLSEAEPESITEVIEAILGATTIGWSIYRIISTIGIILLATGFVVVVLGFTLKEKKIKSFKKRKPVKANAKYGRTMQNKKEKVASFFVTGWGRKNRKPKNIKLRKTKNNKKYII